jgi:hypothetical protein
MYRKGVVAVLPLTLLVGGGLFATWYFEWWPTPEVVLTGVGPRLSGPDESYSNILPADYVGPDACANCHKKQHQLWSGHPHRVMNQWANAVSVKGDFANHVWTVRPGYTVTFTTKANDYFMTVDRPSKERTQYKVMRTVGSRFVQYYIGVQTEGPQRAGDEVYTTEHKLPFGYWLRMKRWLPLAYFDVGEDADELLADGYPLVDGVDAPSKIVPYADTCVHCHNTYPHAYRLFRSNLAGFPDAVITPEMKALSASLADKVTVAPTRQAFAYLPFMVDPNKDLVTMGISCESCHLGGREHANLKKDISFFPTSPHVSVKAKSAAKTFTGKRRDPATSQGICAQCHSSRAEVTHPSGARIRNSGEALDLSSGACATQIRCTTCHEPHTPGVPSGGIDPPQHLDACMSCHEKYSTAEQNAGHSRHPETANVNCMDCHMPRISQGLNEISRSHRIALPVEPSMISKGAPNACNLCHLDKSVRWTLDELKRGWGKTIEPLAQTPAEFLDKPAGKVWMKSSQSITRMVAVNAYARTGLWKANVPEVLDSLNDSNTTNRSFGLFAVERILGRPLAATQIDILAGPAQRSKQAELLRATLETMK